MSPRADIRRLLAAALALLLAPGSGARAQGAAPPPQAAAPSPPAGKPSPQEAPPATGAPALPNFTEEELQAAQYDVFPDLRYAEDPDVPAMTQSLDLVAPPDARHLPVVVWIHGGGWQSGTRRGGLHWKPAFFTHAGFLFCVVDYRLAPKWRYPAFMDDAARAVGWLHQHVADYGGDPHRLVLVGHSAGAHIAALLSTDETWLAKAGVPLKDVAATVLLDGAGYDLARRAKHDVDAENTFEMVFGKDREVWKQASPVTHIVAGRTLPRFLLIHAGTWKAAELEARELGNLLEKSGQRVERCDAPDELHGTIQRTIGTPGDPTTARLLAFLREATRPARRRRPI